MIKRLLLKLHFGWPIILHGFPSRVDLDEELTIDRIERTKLNARLRAAEVELKNLVGSR